jgi:hypothetical protein
VAIAEAIVLPGTVVSLSWSGAAPGTNNPINSYDVYRATALNGTYYFLQNVAASPINVTAPAAAGQAYFYKVLARGQQNTSALSTAVDSIFSGQLPGTPVFVFPTTTVTTHSMAPSIKVTVPAEPNGLTQELEASVDGGAYTSLGAVATGGETKAYALAFSDGNHTVNLRVKNSLGAYGAIASKNIIVTTPVWSRAIATGTVFASVNVSGRLDLTNLQAAVNVIRAYCNLTPTVLIGVGQWARWKPSLEALQTALGECFTAGGKTAPTWATVPSYPTASIINTLRSEVRNA